MDKNINSQLTLSISKDAIASFFSIEEIKMQYLKFNFRDAWCMMWTFPASLLASLIQGCPLAMVVASMASWNNAA